MSDIVIQSDRKTFSYEILREYSIKQKEYCTALAIKKDNSLVLATADKAIKCFQFRQGQLKQFQYMNMFRKDITTLNLFENKSLFIIGSIDSSIRISSTNLISSSKYIQQLDGHSSWISNIIIHPIDQDVIISSSNDSSIKVWQNIQNWICCQTIKEHKKEIKGLSINQQGNQLLSCSDDLQIFIMEPKNQQNYQFWQIIQKINVDQSGYRLCYINDNIFTFQQNSSNHLNIYSKDENDFYSKTGQLEVGGGGQSCDFLFPSIYYSNKQILINKNGCTINIIRYCNQINLNDGKNCQFVLEQTIDYGDYSYGHIWGMCTQDQQYLITWDCDSSEIQIRKYQEKQ
ncbi:unnamed protein product [Paramecium primaurelia]|uniref:WD40-repeat-containing domain n=1 Tax=Paramecium primaurelia TaxID=5886 RepID=A0A8S1L3N5_PARPR|nr:unnamed protein product [Paramecium primaurelia]